MCTEEISGGEIFHCQMCKAENVPCMCLYVC